MLTLTGLLFHIFRLRTTAAAGGKTILSRNLSYPNRTWMFMSGSWDQEGWGHFCLRSLRLRGEGHHLKASLTEGRQTVPFPITPQHLRCNWGKARKTSSQICRLVTQLDVVGGCSYAVYIQPEWHRGDKSALNHTQGRVKGRASCAVPAASNYKGR
jgi:hypothetical protein